MKTPEKSLKKVFVMAKIPDRKQPFMSMFKEILPWEDADL